jgi:hypothetical protein
LQRDTKHFWFNIPFFLESSYVWNQSSSDFPRNGVV